ncbi:MAG: ABC transporter substrate-binding protein [Deltaproteobacteria bacterium]|nr:ABC transporter substrate-binding protein [Deltaproteobacteria bacterium]
MNRIAPALAFVLALLAGLPAGAGSPKEALEGASAKIKKAVAKPAAKGSAAEKKIKEEVRTVVTQFLDYTELARRAMAKFWDERSDAEKTEFAGILKDLIEASYLGKISGNADYSVEFLEESDDGGDAYVLTKLSAKAGSVNVGFKLHKKGDRWLCFDLLIDEVSTLRTYKSEFNKIIKDQSYAALVRKMKDKLEETKKSDK